ncbi:MAG: choline-sulfatase [Spirochaetes bacterium]|nr:MAG: choline-sulfatase [Spirochaetota bacterium]
MKQPNIILLFADDQRFDTIQSLGNRRVHTPNIDSLVKQGTAFTNAHIPGSTCGAVCMPSRAMLHTGRSLYHLQEEGQEIPEDHTLMGEYLQEQGYDCYGIGKWHNGSSSYGRSFSGGDEIFFGGMWDHWNVPANHFDPSGEYSASVPYISDAFHSRSVDLMQSDHISPGKHSTDLFTDAAVNWLSGLNRDSGDSKPFFLNVAFMAPHDPRSMPQKYQDMFNPEDIPIPENFMAEHPFDFGIRNVRDEILAAYPRTESEVRKHIAEYYAMIAHLDDGIGKILNAVEDIGVRENTIVIFAGDNGLALGQHGLFGKQNAYEHSVRVPLIFSGPGIPKGVRRNQPCYLFDIFPTLVDLLEGKRPESVEGLSLKPVIDGDVDVKHRESLYFAYEDKLRAVKKDGYKLIEYAGEESRNTQLFDLGIDPAEITDLSSTLPDVVVTLRVELFRLRDEWDDLSHPTGKRFWDFYNG